MAVLSDEISLVSLSVYFQDAGITGNILDFLAQQQDAPKEVLAAGFAASPETPVKISEIVAVAEDPNAIIELLNVSVTAEE